MKAVMIPATFGQPIKDIKLPNNERDAAEQVRALVGGYMEPIKLRSKDKAILWANEDGKAMQLPRNLRAMFLSNLQPPDFVVGDVVMTGGRGALKLDCPLTASDIKDMLQWDQGGEAA